MGIQPGSSLVDTTTLSMTTASARAEIPFRCSTGTLYIDVIE